MKIRQIPLLLAVLSLVLSSFACGLFTAPEANSIEETKVPLVEPTQETLPVVIETPENSSLPEQPSSLLPDLTTMFTPVDTNNDGVIGICEAVPAEVWEIVMTRPMVGEPTPFEDPSLGEGCAFDFGSEAGAAYFSYMTFASEEQFNNALATAVQAKPVTTLADSAFLNNGSDARQLWVRSGDKAVMAAIGDQENVEGMMVVAPFLLLALP